MAEYLYKLYNTRGDHVGYHVIEDSGRIHDAVLPGQRVSRMGPLEPPPASPPPERSPALQAKWHAFAAACDERRRQEEWQTIALRWHLHQQRSAQPDAPPSFDAVLAAQRRLGLRR